MDAPEPGRRLRREPPTFRRLVVRDRHVLGPRLIRMTVGGPELAGLVLDLPAASVRLLLPDPDADELALPVWNGNEFLTADGRRPVIRTLTPRRHRPDQLELDVDVVLHGPGPASAWAAAEPVGRPVALSGPGRGYALDPDASDVVLAGDETAIPAISQLLEEMDPDVGVRVHLEVADPSAELDLPAPPGAAVHWHRQAVGAAPGDELVEALRSAELGPDTRVWAAGEAAAMQRLRTLLFEGRQVPRSHTTVRGYWKIGRRAEDGTET